MFFENKVYYKNKVFYFGSIFFTNTLHIMFYWILYISIYLARES